MATAPKKTTAKAAPKRTRARTAEGHFIADDPSTPDVNEAFVEETPKPKAQPADEYVWYHSREKEPTMFPVAGINPIRNFSTGRLEYRVKPDDVARFEANHFVQNARIVKKV
jgi:hypothetical protein